MASVTTSVSAAPDPEQREPIGTILLLRVAGDERIMAQLAAALRASAWQIIEIYRKDGSAEAALEEYAVQYGARAVLRADPSAGRVDIWISRGGGTSGGFEESIWADEDTTYDQVVTLRVTEALRARGLDVGAVPEQPREQVLRDVVAPVAPALTRPTIRDDLAPRPPDGRERASIWLEVGPALTLSPGGLPPAFDALASAGLRLYPSWSLAAVTVVPVSRQRIEGTEGKAQIRTLLLAGTFDHHAVRTSHWELSWRVGGGGALTVMSGVPNQGFIGDDETELAGALLAGTSLHYSLGEAWRLSLRTHVGTMIPRLSIRFAEREAAVWGQPFAIMTFGVEASPFTWSR